MTAARAVGVEVRRARRLFFASSNDLVYQFDDASDPQNVVIDLSEQASPRDGAGCLLDGCCMGGCLLGLTVVAILAGGTLAVGLAVYRAVAV